jgi:hypothetical protein
MPAAPYRYVMCDQVRDQIQTLMRTDSRGRRHPLWPGLPRIVARVLQLRHRWRRKGNPRGRLAPPALVTKPCATSLRFVVDDLSGRRPLTHRTSSRG